MKNEDKKIEKLCGFYVSTWHLTTMILPYINRKIDENIKIITILENNIEENIKTLVKKLNLKNEKKVLNINWTSLNTTKYNEIESKLKKEINNENNIILINGCENYIEKNNQNIVKWFTKASISTIKIINFYEVDQFNNNIIEILDKHDKVFNTSGEREIRDVFDGYEKREKISIDEIRNIV